MAKFTSSANSTVTCFAWENLQEFFVMLVAEMLLLSSLEGFFVSGLLFLATNTPTCLLRPVKASTISEFYPGYFQLLNFCQAFPPQFYQPQAFFTLCFLTNIFGTVCDSDAGRNTPSRILLCAWPHRVLSSSWFMGLNLDTL